MEMPQKPKNIIVTGHKIPEEKTLAARNLRKHMTQSEWLLWNLIRNRQLDGYRFRRQQVISGFIADFYCHEAGLVIELDGAGHDKMYDRERDVVFAKKSIQVQRFTNDEVTGDIDAVIASIRQHLKK